MARLYRSTPPGHILGTPSKRRGTPSIFSRTPARSPSGIDQLLDMFQELQTKLDRANEQLQSANFRNGYLESKLEERDSQIKLLMDSQHKPSHWARFKKWLLGQ